MANSIKLAQQFVPLLDETYQAAALTSVLDGNPELVRAGANANELIIPKMSMDGLANYNRNSSTGYVDGNVTMTNETVKCNYDRGRMFNIDTMDNMETAGLAFGRLAGEFIRTKVAPEVDAFRMATYAKATTPVAEDVTKETVSEVISAGITKLDEGEVPADGRYLFINPTLYNAIQDLNTFASRYFIDSFAGVIKMPSARFYTDITLGSNGYTEGTNAKNINFLIVHKDAVIQFDKHVAPKIITPEQNQSSDGYKFGYRNVGICDTYENKLKGIYCSVSTK